LEKVSVEPPNEFEGAESLDNRHQLYGNSMRFKPLSLTEVREDVAWKSDLPKNFGRLVAGLCMPIAMK
jgi:hypothetical protein